MKILFQILKIWFIGLTVFTPIVIALCKAARLGDEGNRLVNTKFKGVFLIVFCLLNSVACAYTDDDYTCTPNYFTKCKIKDGMEYVMLSSTGEQKFSNVKQTQGVPIVVFPAQLKYPIQLPDGSFLGKSKGDKKENL